MHSNCDLPDNIRLGHSLGWSFTPLVGKRPILNGWQSQPRESLDQALAWAAEGNVGLRTGSTSGVFVIDVDVEKGADPILIEALPDTVTVCRGDNRHLYFRAPDVPLGNSVGKLAERVDTRGNGGQVVYAGSIHPDTKQQYTWATGRSPKDIDLAELPEWVVGALTTQAKPLTRYCDTALTTELRLVRDTQEGGRNNQLNKSAFNLGQLVAADELPIWYARKALLDAAIQSGLEESEARATIESGLAAGMANPRPPRLNKPPQSSSQKPRPKTDWRTNVVAAAEEAFADADPSIDTDDPASVDGVMVPGAHTTQAGEYIEVGNHMFAAEVVKRLPFDTVFTRDGVVGELDGEPGRRHFEPLTAHGMRIIVDRHMKLCQWAMKKDEATCSFRNCTRELAELVLAHAAKWAPRLEMIVNYPVYDRTWTRLSPGYTNGIYFDEPPDLADLSPEMNVANIMEVLEDLTCDFPFDSEASRANFNGLLLTPIIRPAINGNTPFHLIISSLERTGKSKLAEEVFGGIILGEPTPAMQITERDEERDKRILALLVRGCTAIHLDNLPQFIDSPSLASLLTARTYQGRVLGTNRIVSLQNNLTVVGSGNNTQASPELVKRVVPIVLQPRSSSPEERTEFTHPDIRAFCSGMRRRVFECLIGAVETWIAAGFPRHHDRMGGFESWSEAIGSIMNSLAYSQWRTNVKDWRKNSDPRSEELLVFVDGWWDEYQRNPVTPKQLAGLAKSIGVFRESYGQTDHSRSVSMGKILGPLVNRPVGEYVIMRQSSGVNRRYYLSKGLDE